MRTFGNFMRLVGLLALFSIFSTVGRAQSRISLQLDGLQDSSVILGYYWGEGKYALDTAVVDRSGQAVFRNDSSYVPGMYLAILPGRWVEFMLGAGPQEVRIEVDVHNSELPLRATGSPVLEDFVLFQSFMDRVQREARAIPRLDSIAWQKDSAHVKEVPEYQEARALGNRLTEEVSRQQQELYARHSEDVLGKFVRSVQSVELPEYEPPEDCKNPDSASWFFRYHFFSQHYLDNVDLGFENILNLPTIVQKVETYLDRILIQNPDTLSKYCDLIIARAARVERNFQFWVSHLFSKYQLSEIVGMDAVFVHIAETYYLSGRTPWVSDETMAKIDERVKALRPNLLGRKAGDFTVETLAARPFHLYDHHAPATVLVFWEPSCSHCRVAIPKIDSIANLYQSQGLAVIGFMTQGDGPAWLDFVNKHELRNWIHVWDPYRKSNFVADYNVHTTPVIYILDHELKIVVKRIGVESVGPVVESLLQDFAAQSGRK